MKALTFSEFGESDVLNYRDVSNPVLKPGEVLVKMEAIGLNFADIYRRKGNYHLKGIPPYIAGYEGAGTIIDSNDTDFIEGLSIGFADVPFANAELVAVPADHIIPLAEEISFDLAASVLLQGLTAHYLATESHSIKTNEFAVVHAAAGGVGQLLLQMVKALGAQPIGLVSSVEKKNFVESLAVCQVYLYEDDWVEKVLNYTSGGADVVYDSVGSTLNDSFRATKERGRVVFYGMSGGDPEPVDPRMLMDTSKTLTGGDLWSFLTSHKERTNRAAQLFEWIKSGEIKPPVITKFQLSEGRVAHDFLESRKNMGKIIMVP
ncbi:zinc-binding dehydrogenase [Pedobacter sp. HMF7647]|uniref:Zinc-binding dehydrogenase n=1 Tax=Hufsiella arboris TaxID=2695275 RepID=A0A7K1Y7M8_9SPHI|nr:quinone oxidoreductase [Hufsiella arboris]MXV50582.1 zinc-binding dehydrogenase [Hufsiella arboris]